MSSPWKRADQVLLCAAFATLVLLIIVIGKALGWS